MTIGCDWLGQAAIALGCAERAVAGATAYAGSRVQGGAPISEHAAIRLLLGRAEHDLVVLGAVLETQSWVPLAEIDPLSMLRWGADARLTAGEHGGRAVTDVLAGLRRLRVHGRAGDVQATPGPGSPTGPPRRPRPVAAAPPGAGSGGDAMRSAELRRSAELLKPLGRLLFDMDEKSLWERETATLPRQMARRRRAYRDFGCRELTPLAAGADATPTGYDPRPLLATAARAGLQSEDLPPPWGTMVLGAIRYPLFPEVLKAEELAAVCAGLGQLSPTAWARLLCCCVGTWGRCDVGSCRSAGTTGQVARVGSVRHHRARGRVGRGGHRRRSHGAVPDLGQSVFKAATS